MCHILLAGEFAFSQYSLGAENGSAACQKKASVHSSPQVRDQNRMDCCHKKKKNKNNLVDFSLFSGQLKSLAFVTIQKETPLFDSLTV